MDDTSSMLLTRLFLMYSYKADEGAKYMKNPDRQNNRSEKFYVHMNNKVED